jgi:hypothetical protein
MTAIKEPSFKDFKFQIVTFFENDLEQFFLQRLTRKSHPYCSYSAEL